MTNLVLHYINDPLCGWCYAAEPLVQAAADAGIPLMLHGGGLWEPETHASEAKRANMRENDSQIARMTGQPFGAAYLEGMLFDPATVWWSRPTIAAVLAAEALEVGQGLPMMATLQRAHYLDGKRVVETAVLLEVASQLGMDASRFAKSFAEVPVDAHIRKTRAMMQRFGLNGFPSFLLARDRSVARFPHENHYGDPSGRALGALRRLNRQGAGRASPAAAGVGAVPLLHGVECLEPADCG